MNSPKTPVLVDLIFLKTIQNISSIIVICRRADQTPPVRKSDDYEKYNIAELEKKAVEAAKEATLAYTVAINELKGKIL